MKQPRFSLLIAFIVIALLAVGGLFLAHQGVQNQPVRGKNLKSASLPSSPIKKGTTTITQPPEEPSLLLKRYQDADLGFALNYPRDWQVSKEGRTFLINLPSDPEAVADLGQGDRLPALVLNVEDNPDGLSAEEWFREQYVPEKTLEAFIEGFGRLKINGDNAIHFRDTLALGTPLVYIMTSDRYAYIWQRYDEEGATRAIIESFVTQN